MEFNLAQVHHAVERAIPDRDLLITGDERLTYRQFGDRARRIANALLARGLGTVVERDPTTPYRSGQDHIGLFLHNRVEQLETMLGAITARVAPFTVNHRYLPGELAYVLADAAAEGLVFQSALAPVVERALADLPRPRVLWQVADGSGHPLVDGAEWYHEVRSAQPASLPEDLPSRWSPDDLYLLYTGGTTGRPKAVLWRQADVFVAALGGRRPDGAEWDSLKDLVAHAERGGATRLPCGPLMHGAAQWLALGAPAAGDTIVLSGRGDRFDPVDVADRVERERVEILGIVGDAFGRPLAEQFERGDRDLSSLLVVVSGGAPLSPVVARRLLAAVPSMVVVDGLGASETGQQARRIHSAGRDPASTFATLAGATVLSEGLDHELDRDSSEIGWLAQSGRVPLGYLNDPDRSARTFPTVGGRRCAVPGDRARWLSDGSLELLGRESSTINTGGEKVFAEEVEAALVHHRAVADCIVIGRPSSRWGEEVVAVVELLDGVSAADADLLEEAARHIARYKLPKCVVRVDRVHRSAAGKADYRWAAQVVAGAQQMAADRVLKPASVAGNVVGVDAHVVGNVGRGAKGKTDAHG